MLEEPRLDSPENDAVLMNREELALLRPPQRHAKHIERMKAYPVDQFENMIRTMAENQLAIFPLDDSEESLK
jgi:hypothetical protein